MIIATVQTLEMKPAVMRAQAKPEINNRLYIDHDTTKEVKKVLFFCTLQEHIQETKSKKENWEDGILKE